MVRLLLDEQMPRRLRSVIPNHTVRTVRDMGWSGLKNGALLRQAESEFDVFVTMDRGIPFQQAIRSLKLGVLLVRARSNSFSVLAPHATRIGQTASTVTPGRVVELELPTSPGPDAGSPSA